MVDKRNGNDKPRRRRGRKTEDESSVKRKSKSSTSDAPELSADELQFRPHKSLLIHLTEETPTWYECGRHTPGRNDTIFSDPPPVRQSSQLVSQYRNLADSIYKVEVQLFSGGGTKDEQWVETTMKRGTLKDRIAAMSVVVSTDPVHKLYALDGLLQLAGCSESNPGQANSRVAQMAAEALADLFLNTLLPSNRKLVMLDQRPLYRYSSSNETKKTNKTLSPRILLLWRYEEILKLKYQLFLRHYLTRTLREGMEIQKVFCLRTAGTLLRSLPEGEAQLLSIMVNKLGDPSKKIAASAGHELRRVLAQHSNMQLVVAREVQQLSHRPQLSPRALYNCIIFLNQLKLFREEEPDEEKQNGKHNRNHSDDEQPKNASPSTNLPASLINTYFRLFEVAVNKTKKDPKTAAPSSLGMESRLLSALLTGVNRAHPYLPAKDKHMEEHIDALYRIVHTAPPSACTQALMLLFHLAVGSEYEESAVVDKKASVTEKARQDRFYRALYAALSQTSLVSSGKHLTMFFNLVYKAMKYDTDSTRVVAMAKRLLCTTLHCNAPVVAASLFLLNEVMKYHPVLKSSLKDIAKGEEARAMLNPTKREPRAALVSLNVSNEKSKSTVGESLKSAPLWEVALISQHFHPSVSKFATSLGDISYAGDPLRDFSLAPFLDKFAYRNPKSAKSVAQHWKRGESVAERKSGTEGEIEALMALPVNDPAFMEKANFNEQEEFFRKFFVERARRDEIKGIVRGKGAAADSDEDEEGERKAFDEAEGMEVDHDFDADYDTDSEEEAFVHSLAEKLMASSANGKVNYDDEDPDMEGWSDLDDYADDDGSNDDDVVGEIGMDANGEQEIDDDAFMDSSGDESESNEDSDSDAGSADLALVTGSSSDSEEEDNDNDGKPTKNRASTSFADASEYETMIEKSWNERKRPKLVAADAEEEKESKVEAIGDFEGSKKRRKRRKKGRNV